ncbi:hypothetical protein ONZ51_g3243 [Trametes cubensis]|uniref:Uncharacterized protein n=1 Tax=Trametes cubensis TaxID=1111947 RepID=A0AAD7TY17_9APHY|nr:hypothetical protein ONZ51_g3243 [Trametes cubensis]
MTSTTTRSTTIRTSTRPKVRMPYSCPSSSAVLTPVCGDQVFNTPFWRRAALAAVGVVAFYKFAPAPGDENPIGKFIARTMTPAEVWRNAGWKHLVLSKEVSEETKLVTTAKPPPVHRYRFPQRMEMYSPNLQPVGIKLDVGDVVVKRD